MNNPYPGGQCTWGAAEMCSCLQNLSVYGNFGNGGDWYAHAQSIGLPISNNPQVGWLASFSTGGWPNGPGDVGLITAVNDDGTVTRYGTNWHMDGKWSTDKVPVHLVIGSFKPPCDCTGGNANTLFSSNSQCMTFQWSLPLGVNVCFDGILGMVAVGGGILLMATGLIVLAIALGQKLEAPKPQRMSVTATPAEQQVTQRLTPQQQSTIAERARLRASQRALEYRAKRPPVNRREAKT